MKHFHFTECPTAAPCTMDNYNGGFTVINKEIAVIQNTRQRNGGILCRGVYGNQKKQSDDDYNIVTWIFHNRSLWVCRKLEIYRYNFGKFKATLQHPKDLSQWDRYAGIVAG